MCLRKETFNSRKYSKVYFGILEFISIFHTHKYGALNRLIQSACFADKDTTIGLRSLNPSELELDMNCGIALYALFASFDLS